MFRSTTRKALAVTTSLALAFSVSACNRESSDTTAAEGETAGSITLALSTQSNPFFVQLRDGAQDKADELGVTLNIQDASDDAATQSNQVNNAATTGADVVIINPTDSDAIVPAVEALNQADIPVVAVDRSANGGEVASSSPPITSPAVPRQQMLWPRPSAGKARSSCCRESQVPPLPVSAVPVLKKRSPSMRALKSSQSSQPTLTAPRAWMWPPTCSRHTQV